MQAESERGRMKPLDEEEPQRFMGFPISRWPLERGRREPGPPSQGTAGASGKSRTPTATQAAGPARRTRPAWRHTAVETDQHPVTGPLSQLVDVWCERRDLHALARVLPGYTAHLGPGDAWGDLLRALQALRAECHLPEDEQQDLERLIVTAERIARP
jgi:hypothetical protein